MAENPLVSIMKYCWHYAKGRRFKFVLFLCMSFIANSFVLVGPYIMGEVFNSIQRGGPQIIQNIMFWLSLMLGATLLFWIFHGPARVIEREMAFYIRGQLWDDLYAKLRSLPLKWHQDHHSGNTINRIRKSGEAIKRFVERMFLSVETIVRLFGPIVILFFLSWPVALVALVLNIATLLALWRFDIAIMRWLAKENDLEHKYSASLFDYIANFTTIITLRLGLRTQQELQHNYGNIHPAYSPHVILNEWKYFILNMGASVLMAVVLMIYIWQQLDSAGVLMVGTVVAIYRYLDILRDAFFGFAGVYQEVLANHTNFKSVAPILEDAEKFGQLELEHKTVPANWKKLSISGLTFRHGVDEKPTLENLDFSFERGQWVALVGESGAGKSTLMALLRGLYEPEQVSIKVDNKTYNTLMPLRETTTLIPQEPEIFENSIRYNISVGLHHTEKQLAEATSMARFNPVLERLPAGLETDVREKGVNLSGGEKQRLALARGLFAAQDSSIVLLDEATSSVDIRNELAIHKNIRESFTGKTVISSLHKLNLIKFFDVIAVMKNGRIVEYGTHKELLAQNGLFAELWEKYKDSH